CAVMITSSRLGTARRGLRRPWVHRSGIQKGHGLGLPVAFLVAYKRSSGGNGGQTPATCLALAKKRQFKPVVIADGSHRRPHVGKGQCRSLLDANRIA